MGIWDRLINRLLPRLTHRLELPGQADAQAVVEAAWHLRIGEFDLFRLAYRRWYGAEPRLDWLERVFARYMFHRRVPPWVRQFCRDVLERAGARALDRRDFGADMVPRREPLVDYPTRFIAAAMIAMLLLYLVVMWLF